ncbi:AAA family ATPase [Rhizobium sp. UGM030330-04]|uniref:AAA family ATPase n=1 Tax=Rhizobium sp. UGM030330-04 TaxID=1378077 RepID=UPI000D92004D|nr:AAA family ATPase [Rhizobium sp. UGM030330-04]PYG54730.1 putative ATPase [Rhizobium sp. UGM030330-04]
MLKFKVSNLGRVRSASVQLAPLTILVGKNDTGKSYLATLIWALNNLNLLLSNKEARSRRPKWIRDFFSLDGFDTDREIIIDAEKGAELIKYLNDLFRRQGAEFLAKVFAFDGFDRTSVSVETTEFEPFTMRFSRVREVSSDGDEREDMYVRVGGADDHLSFGLQFERRFFEETNVFQDLLFQQLLSIVVNGYVRPFGGVSYIPAARTGLMLTYNSIASDRFAPTGAQNLDLPMPLTAFLQKLSATQSQFKDSKSKLAKWLQETIMSGDIVLGEGKTRKSLAFRPSGSELELPLHATSSMITELAPYLIEMKSYIRGKHFILEEPEAHLHLEAQREMARAISRLIAAGAQVTLTTHSDTFLQQINNLMSLSDHPKRRALMKEFGYKREDIISPDMAEAYEFNSIEGATDVQKIKKTPEGFVVPSLNRTLLSLARETLAIREKQRND